MRSSSQSFSEEPFLTTRWADVDLFHTEGPDSDSARSRVCEAYWYPLHVFMRIHLHKLGADVQSAGDHVQGFFQHVFDKEIFRNASPEKGSFRSFLCACLKNFVADEWKTQSRAKRRPIAGWLSIDEDEALERFESHLSWSDPPEVAYDRAWALQIISHALEVVRLHYSDDSMLFEALAPLLQGEELEESYRKIGERFGRTEQYIKTTAYRMRARFKELVDGEIARSVGWQGADPVELQRDLRNDVDLKRRFDVEKNHLLTCLAR
jgi:DNA-directed RNA polymerase specialized sigma24 family protein